MPDVLGSVRIGLCDFLVRQRLDVCCVLGRVAALGVRGRPWCGGRSRVPGVKVCLV